MGTTGFDRLAPVQRDSTVSIIVAQLREAIIDGTFSPGMQLSEAQLADRLAVSRGPVREAIQRLIQEELLRAEPNRGVFVVELLAADIRDIYVARAAIERTALRALIRERDEQAYGVLSNVLDDMGEAIQARDASRTVDLELRFHEGLVAASGSPRLQRMFRTLLAETRMTLAGLEGGPEIWLARLREHRAILDAARRGDETQALALLEDQFDAGVAESAPPRTS